MSREDLLRIVAAGENESFLDLIRQHVSFAILVAMGLFI